MYTKPQSFREYCLNRGVELLRDDIYFINTQIAKLDQSSRRAVLSKYCEIWITSMNLCDNENGKQNTGRRSANIFLRSKHEAKDRTLSES
jgi:hypothetical protein